MDYITNLANLDYFTTVFGFLAILFAAKEIIEIFVYFKNKFRIKTGLSEDKERFEERIALLEKHDNWQYKEIVKISNGISNIQDTLLKSELENKRKSILSFCTALSNKQKENKEAFNEIFRTYEEYERILKEHNMENGQTEQSMKFISEVYQQMLRDGELS